MSRPAIVYWVLPFTLLAVAIAGYGGYVLYPRFDLSAAQGIGLLALAAAAGIASFFSPCSFPLLVTLLTASARTQNVKSSPREAWRFALGMALGAGLFLLLMGTVIAAGSDALFSGITFTSTAGRVVRLAAGGALVTMGLLQLNLIPGPDFHRLESLTGGVSEGPIIGSTGRSAAYGFGYVLTGVG
jgi:cytochrome c biogenesis protein CcdA